MHGSSLDDIFFQFLFTSKVFISSSHLKDNFTGYGNLVCFFFFLSAHLTFHSTLFLFAWFLTKSSLYPCFTLGIIFFSSSCYHFFPPERERETHAWVGGRSGQRQREKRIKKKNPMTSAEPNAGLDLITLRSWHEPESKAMISQLSNSDAPSFHLLSRFSFCFWFPAVCDISMYSWSFMCFGFLHLLVCLLFLYLYLELYELLRSVLWCVCH